MSKFSEFCRAGGQGPRGLPRYAPAYIALDMLKHNHIHVHGVDTKGITIIAFTHTSHFIWIQRSRHNDRAKKAIIQLNIHHNTVESS